MCANINYSERIKKKNKLYRLPLKRIYVIIIIIIIIIEVFTDPVSFFTFYNIIANKRQKTTKLINKQFCIIFDAQNVLYFFGIPSVRPIQKRLLSLKFICMNMFITFSYPHMTEKVLT